MQKLHYLAILERGISGTYGVFFPDLPGCVTVGNSELEAWSNAESVLNLHVAGLLEDGEILPAPTAPSMIARDPEVDEVARILVGVEAAPPKVRVNVMLDANLLKAIDRVCDNRSQFLGEAARTKLQDGRLAPAKTVAARRRRSVRLVPMK
jgi:predicted RNase H-like HicB family nuclease